MDTLNRDCLGCIVSQLDDLGRMMFRMCNKLLLGTKITYKRKYVKRDAFRIGRFVVLEYLQKELRMEISSGDIHHLRDNIDGTLLFDWFWESRYLTSKSRELVELCSCFVKRNSSRELDFHCLSTLAKYKIFPSAGQIILIYEKWDYRYLAAMPIFKSPSAPHYRHCYGRMKSLENELLDHPDVVAKLNAKKSFALMRSVISLPDPWLQGVALSSLINQNYEMFDEAFALVKDKNDLLEWIGWNIIQYGRFKQLQFLLSRILLLDSTFLQNKMRIRLVNKFGVKHIKVFQILINSGIIPYPINYSHFLLRECDHYPIIELLGRHGVYIDTTGRIIKRFPSKAEELKKLGFR